MNPTMRASSSSRTIRLGLITTCALVTACVVYDDALLPAGPGGSAGTGGAAENGGATMPDDAATMAESSAGGAQDDDAGDVVAFDDVARAPADSNAVDAPIDVVIAVEGAVSASDASVAAQCPVLVDNMESGSGHVLDACRNGYWFTYNDNADAGRQQPSPGPNFNPERLATPRGTSLLAAHTFGSGHEYAGLGVNLNSPPGTTIAATYDASAFSGFTFFAMGTGTIVPMIPDVDTYPQGGVCGVADRSQCYDHFGGRPIVLTSSWQQYTIHFADLLQEGFGYRPPTGFNSSAIYGFQWQVTSTANFEIWIDDLAFTTSSSDAAE